MAIVIDPRFRAGGAGDQPDEGGSILRYIAAKTPGVDYYPPTDQLGSYGHGPRGEPTFEPFHHAYVDWLVKRTQEEDAPARSRPRGAAYPPMFAALQPAVSADPGGRSADGSFQVAQSESDAWRREIGKYYPHFQTDAAPPPDKTRQELLDQAQRDDAAAASMQWYGKQLEGAGDDIDDMDTLHKEYAEKPAGLPGSADAFAAAHTVAGIKLQEAAKRRRERAQQAREQAAKMPK